MTLVNRRVLQDLALIAAALFAFCWAVMRARVQSITIDEATSFLLFCRYRAAFIFWPSSNNHILNSALMWLTTHAFGISSLTVRAPALMGALLYIVICYFLCRVITDDFILRFLILICLLFNPLVMDFMVAARGYGMGGALLLTAIAISIGGLTIRRRLPACTTLSSVALGLSFAANFSFAFVDAAALAAILVWAIRRRGSDSIARIVVYCVVPGLFVAMAMCGYALMHWNRDESLSVSATSIADTIRSIADDSLFGLHWKPWILPVLAILCVGRAVVVGFDGFAAVLTAIGISSLAMHWLAFHFFRTPLPLDRKALYLIPLFTLVVGIVAATPSRSAIGLWLQRAMKGGLLLLACFYLLCLRRDYFQEWQWGEDTKDVYSELTRLNARYGVTDVASSWYYAAVLNFYRAASDRQTFPEFEVKIPYPDSGKSVYVMNGLFEKEFLDREKLVVVYRGKSTPVVIAVRRDSVILE
jgi:hypothetical protein